MVSDSESSARSDSIGKSRQSPSLLRAVAVFGRRLSRRFGTASVHRRQGRRLAHQRPKTVVDHGVGHGHFHHLVTPAVGGHVSALSLWNAPDPITTPTYDGSGSAVHPDVIDFGPTGWRGWRFWMAMTPYPGQNSDYENPSILVSNDAVTWQVPDGLTNPVYPKPQNGHSSDTDLSYDPAADELVLVFRDYDYTPRVARSSDGVKWPSSPTVAEWTAAGTHAASPCLVRILDTEWWMWQVVKLTAEPGAGTPRAVYRWTAPAPEGPWSDPTPCTGFPENSPDDPTIWHADVVRSRGQFFMLAAEGREDEHPSAFHTATSLDGLAWTYSATPIIAEGSGDWDSGHLYRGTIQPDEGGSHMRVWYGGRPEIGVLYRIFQYAGGNYRIGLTLVPLSEWPDPLPRG